jgi:CubicO group peptidase (beta-lactamase class C family)
VRDRELGLPIQGDTIFRIYSLTKFITSVAALTLIEEGKLGLLQPVEEYLPEFSDRQIFVGGTAQQMGLTPAKVPFEQMTVDHLGGLRVTNRTYTEGYGFGLGVAVRINNGLAGTLGTLASFGWSGKATTLCSVDPAEQLVMLIFTQHLPYDEHGLFERFTNLVYQALE